MAFQFRGKYLEDFQVDDVYYTPYRTVTEGDIVQYASFSGDWNPLHTDKEYAQKGPFQERIAHGLVSLAIATGLMDKIGIIEGTCIAFMGLTWRFVKAVMIGDSITMELRVKETRKTKKPDRGLVTFEVKILNQKQETVSEGEWHMLMATLAEG